MVKVNVAVMGPAGMAVIAIVTVMTYEAVLAGSEVSMANV